MRKCNRNDDDDDEDDDDDDDGDVEDNEGDDNGVNAMASQMRKWTQMAPGAGKFSDEWMATDIRDRWSEGRKIKYENKNRIEK